MNCEDCSEWSILINKMRMAHALGVRKIAYGLSRLFLEIYSMAIIKNEREIKTMACDPLSLSALSISI